MLCVFVCKQKTAYEMRISDWSSDVCSSDRAVISAFDAGAAQATHRQWCEAVRTTVLEQRWHALLAPDDDHGATDQDALRHRPALDLGRQRRNIPGIREK